MIYGLTYYVRYVTVLIPCLGDKEPIIETVNMIDREKIKKLGFYLSIIIIATPDKNGNHISINNDFIRTIVEKKQGYGSAYKTGLNYCKNHNSIIITADADGTYPLDTIDQILVKYQFKNEFISINRMKNRNNNAFTTINKIGNRLLTLWTNLLFQTKFKDSQSGMWIISPSIIPILQEYHYGNGMEYSTEIKIIAKFNPKIKFYEIDGNYYPRKGGNVSLNWLVHGLRVFLHLLLFRIRHLFI